MRHSWSFVLLACVGWLGPEVLGQEPPERAKGERYALVVGVRKYDPNELRSLPYSEADANDLAKTLRAGGYRPDNVVLMTQAAGAEEIRLLPTADRIRKELALLAADCDPDDTVIVALAGHGVQFRGETESYFCPTDARLADKSTLLPLSEVYKELDRCPASFKLLLVDACRNDPMSSNSRSREVVNLESISRPQAVPPPGGVSALYSCSAGERAFEHDELKHGVFFHYVIESLTGAAANGDGLEGVTLPEMEVYVKRHVRDFVRAKYGVRQMPERVGIERGLVPLVAFDPAGRALRWGLELSQRKDYDAAIASLDEALRINPKLIAALQARGVARAEKEDFNAAFRAGGADAKLYRLRAEAYADAGQFTLALADAEEAIRQAPKDSESYISRAYAFSHKGEHDRAIADSIEAIRLDPMNAVTYSRRGSVYSWKGDHDRAIADFTEAIKLDSKNATTYLNRGVSYDRKGDFDRAIADYNESIRLDPKKANAYSSRGSVYKQKGNSDRAIADCTEAIRLDPKNALAYNYRGSAYDDKADQARAIADYNEAIKLDPKLAVAYNNRGIAYYKKNDYVHALADLDIATQLDPGSALFAKNRAGALSQAKTRR